MCTLIALHRCDPTAPLLVAANRDEYLERPATAPQLGRVRGRTVLAPRDERAGGSWLGVNDAGVFAALTNRPTPGPDGTSGRDDTRRSRGLLVLDALGSGTALEAAHQLEKVEAGAYNPFNLMLADSQDAFVVVYEDKPALASLEPGAHVLGNADPDDRAVPKLAWLLEEAEAAAALPSGERVEALASLCRRHDGPGDRLGSPCIHAGEYGTRSSTLLSLAQDGRAGFLRHAEGPPCETSYEDYTPLLHELRSPRNLAAGETSARRMR